MKLIIGLGNPGEKYKQTRHNAGFLALDFFMKNLQVINCASKFDAQICEFQTDGNKLFFIKPQNFMNNSGKVISEIVQFYKVSPTEDILIIHDDKDLRLGDVKSTLSSRSAGHNGIEDIFTELGTQDIKRIRIGVESREPGSPIPTDVFVLQNFSDEELAKLQQEILPKVSTMIAEFIK